MLTGKLLLVLMGLIFISGCHKNSRYSGRFAVGHPPGLGLPVGGDLGYADTVTLTRALRRGGAGENLTSQHPFTSARPVWLRAVRRMRDIP